MQSISRFLAVLIALIFLIGPLAGTAAAHETEDGDHEGADYGSLTLTRQDDLGDMVHVDEVMQFGVMFTPSGDHTAPSDQTTVNLMGVTTATPLDLSTPGRTFDYTVVGGDLGNGDIRTITLYLQYMYTPAGDADTDPQTNHAEQTIKSNEITITVLPALSDVATLDDLALTKVTLAPDFETGQTTYSAAVGYDVMETTVTAETNEDGTYTVTKDGDTYDDGVVPLAVGPNPIVVTVTAENGSVPGDSTNVYTVTVTRIGEQIMDGVMVGFMASIDEGDVEGLDEGDTVTFTVTVKTGAYGIYTDPNFDVTIVRYRGDHVKSEQEVVTDSNLGTPGTNSEDSVEVTYNLAEADVAADVSSIEFVFETTFEDITFRFEDIDPDSEATRYEGRTIRIKSGETSGTTTTTTTAAAPAAAPAAARAAAPAASGPPLGEIGRSGSATATVLAGDVLQIVRHDGGATLNIGIGWTATNDSSQVLVGFIRDEGLGQTYAIVRREDDGMVVRRWVEPGSADVFAVPWADVIANYTVPTDVVVSIPLDDRHPAQLMLARRFDGADDRIFVHIGNGVWSHIPNYATFLARGFEWQNVTAADSGFFNRINIGAPLPSSGG